MLATSSGEAGPQGLSGRVCAGIAYLDPGNLESQLQAGAQAGYDLMWVLLWVIIMVSAWNFSCT